MASNTTMFTASQANREAKKFKSLRLKLMNLDKSIWFNKKCIELNLTPKYVPIKTVPNTPASIISTKQAKALWIKNELRFAYIRKQKINQQLYDIQLQLSNFWHAAQWDSFTEHLHDTIKIRATRKHETLENKLRKLGETQNHQSNEQHTNNNEFNFHSRVNNRTNVTFSQGEMNMLDKGLKYNCTDAHTNHNIKQLITDIEIASHKLPAEDRELTKNLATNEAKKILKREGDSNNIQNNKQIKEIKSLKQKIKEHDLIITKADKGNTTVILNKTEYIEKTVEFLNNNEIKELTKDPTNKFQKQIKSALKETEYILTKAEKSKLINMNPKIPSLRGQPKIHKKECPMRPIVNCRNAPNYKISKELLKILKCRLSNDKNNSVKNTTELVTALNTLQMKPSFRLVSFDVTNMYTNIPIIEAINTIENNLKSNNSVKEIEEIVRLLRVVLTQNVFQFDNKIYTQREGLAMGSPLSGLIADIFINALENAFLEKTSTKGIVIWKRYVDDVICIYDTELTSEETILQSINSLHHSIKFTKESETDRKINYLDITIERKELSSSYLLFQ